MPADSKSPKHGTGYGTLKPVSSHFGKQKSTLNPKVNPEMPFKLDPRRSLSQTAYRLKYAEHILQNEFDEIESALTEEDLGHPNIEVLALMMQRLSSAQANLAEVIKLFGEKSE